MDWNPDYRYKVLGKMVQANGKALIAFDLTSSECFPKVVNRDGKKVSSRQSVFAEQWSGRFGPTYSESRRSLAVKTFDNTIKRYGTLAAQMDKIAEKDEVLFGAILAEKIPITYARWPQVFSREKIVFCICSGV